MINVDYLIVGQGIAGTLLSYELMKANKSVMVLDKPNSHAIASLVAGAVINPLAGKNWQPSLAQQLYIPQALATYKALGQQFQTDIVKETTLFVFHESGEKQNEAIGRLQTVSNEKDLQNQFSYQFGAAQISPLYLVDAQTLLSMWRQYLIAQNSFRLENFEHNALLEKQDGITYEDIQAKKIIFCEGAAESENPLFKKLPFTKNRGEALLLHIPDLKEQQIYHQGNLRLVPKGDGLFWCGSNYQWNFENLWPDETWRSKTLGQLKQWLTVPFTVADHIVAERPTTAGQFPLIGSHPDFPRTYIFNGLGTRGFSSGPYWAKHLALQLEDESYVIPDYDTLRLHKLF